MHDRAILLPEGQRRLRDGERADEQCENDSELDWRHPTHKGEERSRPLPVEFEWRYTRPFTPHMKAALHVSEFMDFSSERVIPCASCRALVDNLLIGRRYYWKVVLHRGKELVCESPIGMFATSNQAPRLIRADGLSNIRDIGGWKTREGREIRQELIYRGCEMDTHFTLTDEGKRTLRDELRVRTDLDLRGEAVGKVSESPMGEDVRFELIPIKAYGEFFAPEEMAACQKVISLLADAAAYPIYMHCWGGADRTGTLVLLLGALLGVDDESLIQEYEMTSFSVFGPRTRSMELFLTLLDALNQFGTEEETMSVKAHRYLLKAGVEPAVLEKIKKILLK